MSHVSRLMTRGSRLQKCSTELPEPEATGTTHPDKDHAWLKKFNERNSTNEALGPCLQGHEEGHEEECRSPQWHKSPTASWHFGDEIVAVELVV